MLIDTRLLPKDERTYLELCDLFEKHGYALYKMKKFEEYSLYLDNKNFLGSESVLTFQGFGGKLMALKPDVTLSIVKNARVPENGALRLYYRESVYRTERGGTDFKEINQMGLECIGALTLRDVTEICALAVQSLALIDSEFVFAVSHMGYLSALLDECGVRDEESRKAKARILTASRASWRRTRTFPPRWRCLKTLRRARAPRRRRRSSRSFTGISAARRILATCGWIFPSSTTWTTIRASSSRAMSRECPRSYSRAEDTTGCFRG